MPCSTRLLRCATTAMAVLALPLLWATAAPAKITSNGIAGVELGMTERQVTAVAGPYAERLVGDEPSDFSLTFPDHGRLLVNLVTERDAVYLVATTSRWQRTRNGLGPGVSEQVLRKRLRGERCARLFDADRRVMVTDCAPRARGEVRTTYRLRKRKVLEVIVEDTRPPAV